MATGGISRRRVLVGAGAGTGLLLAWSLWPRSYAPNLSVGPGETAFNAFLKIGIDGRVIVAVPQAELGQGVMTSLPQILADELGADWRTVAVEPAPVGPLYANRLLAEGDAGNGILSGISRWSARDHATMMTRGSSSIRAFEAPLREAGASARALLMMAAAKRWDTDWEGLDTAAGFVTDGNRRLSFAELAAQAAEMDIPDQLPMRGGIDNRLTGKPLPRIDLPAKVDGSALFAADIRLPDMVYASVRQGPRGDSRLIRIDRAAADRVPGVLAVFENPHWAGAAATNWWAADQAVQAMKPVFETRDPASSAAIDAALAAALEGADYARIVDVGDAEAAVQGKGAIRADYAVGLAANAPLETLTATARLTGDRIEIWAPTQAPAYARAAAARAAGMAEAQVALYPTLVGGGYGRKLEMAAIAQVAVMACQLKRPVQLTWSRTEEMLQDSFRPPARARMAATMTANGTIGGWHARIATPATALQVRDRLEGAVPDLTARSSAAAVAGAAPPYAIPSVAIDHLPVAIGLDTGVWRSEAHSSTAFFTESFIDELARSVAVEPLSYRMQMLGANPRLARVLATATALGGWDGGALGSAMGIAAHSAYGSHVATLVEVEVNEAQQVRVLRAVAAVDCGRVVNPDIVRQLIEGGIIHGISGATGAPITLDKGLPSARRLSTLGLPRLADSPEITVEILPSDEEPGGVTELGVPSVAPAIANALFALTGKRLRSLPLRIGAA